jgi:AcrR family transcriptional regulator
MATDTKEAILRVALHLFSTNGYKAVSVEAIAAQLNMTKGALYRHYKNKRAIFDCILDRMRLLDFQQARAYQVPEGTSAEMPQAYETASLSNIKAYTKAQFAYWTENEFASDFRKMLTLEQYGSEEMRLLYQQYLSSGPLEYTADLFLGFVGDQKRAHMCALHFYAPVYQLYSLYDAAQDKDDVKALMQAHVDGFTFDKIPG